ncbi:Y-family DNA polymerase [Parasedimentitalea psychrophila]|uniref:DNA polymerase Y family protein n=1 Tax=Parasedimentitalea psychrophila TaxID=2997337 RepID=A0A9Y2L3B3_9RHOB|nr:DNA polymerase Y family protein [Parasedimentitalea psychrophila]WIY26617.1 DNA polymerase Y family protein [Parasedimentitalea psychrophila]
MSHRRILSLWFPRLGAERLMRAKQAGTAGPLAVVEELSNTQVISALNCAAVSEGLWVGQPVRDAYAMCGHLLTRSRNAPAERVFLTALRRWAGKYSPWVAEQEPDGLVIDLTGCAHLFGGEAGMLAQVEEDCSDMGLGVQLGLADSLGAAWALARYAGVPAGSDRSGDAISQEARATRAKAQNRSPKDSAKRRHWTRGGAAPQMVALPHGVARIADPGQTYGALAPLPVAALRLEGAMVAQLNRLGLRRVSDLMDQPRASLARRFGRGLVMRLDQAMGSAPEPVSPGRAPDHFAVRLTLPEPIGLIDDLMAGVDRMLPRLCARLEERGKGMRSLRLEAHRTDQAAEVVVVGFARPLRDPGRIRPLLEMKLDQIDAGFGIDMLRLEALQVEPIHARTVAGHVQAGAAAQQRVDGGNGLEDLIGRLGARVGLEMITRYHPVDTHIPEKTAKLLAAAWSEPAPHWPAAPQPRPLLMWQPELVSAADSPVLSDQFRWRGQHWQLAQAQGPERIAPEWWLDDPNWRNGVRDYWVVVTSSGARLWLFYAHGGGLSPGWFCQGSFA